MPIGFLPMRTNIPRPSLLALLPLVATLSAQPSVDPATAPSLLLSDDAYHAVSTFYDYDSAIPLDARVVDQNETPAYRREKIAFTTSTGERIAGWFALPKAVTTPPPCVLVLHGVGSNKDSWWRADNPTGPLVPRLLEAGYAVFMLDAAYFGERSYLGDFANPQNFVGKSNWLYRFRDLIVRTTVDYRRALDYLATRTDIDPVRRAVFGYSMGGVTAVNLLAVEPRLQAGVVCVAPPMLGSGTAPASMPPAARARLAAIAPDNHARALADKPVLFLMARKDIYYTAEDAEGLVARVPGSAKQLKFFDSGHMLPHAYIDDAVAWFVQHLKP